MQTKYKVGDTVQFNSCESQLFVGKIKIVDSYGTFEQKEEPSYDIFVREHSAFNGAPCLIKHVRESEILGLWP